MRSQPSNKQHLTPIVTSRRLISTSILMISQLKTPLTSHLLRLTWTPYYQESQRRQDPLQQSKLISSISTMYSLRRILSNPICKILAPVKSTFLSSSSRIRQAQPSNRQASYPIQCPTFNSNSSSSKLWCKIRWWLTWCSTSNIKPIWPWHNNSSNRWWCRRRTHSWLSKIWMPLMPSKLSPGSKWVVPNSTWASNSSHHSSSSSNLPARTHSITFEKRRKDFGVEERDAKRKMLINLSWNSNGN